MTGARADNFARVRVLGVEYACSSGKAVACHWDPLPEEQEKVEVPSVVVADGREYTVEVFCVSLFSKSVIRSFFIPNTVTFLPKKCFEFCENLVDVCFASESRIDSFESACFKRCGLCEIDIPNSVISIGSKCFDGCVNMCRVRIGEESRLQKIGEFAFRGCNISDLYLPRYLDICGYAIFLGVKSVNIGNNPKVFISNECLMSQDRKALIRCFSSNSTFEVPDSIRVIDWYCFSGSNVKKVVFGRNSNIKHLEVLSLTLLLRRLYLKREVIIILSEMECCCVVVHLIIAWLLEFPWTL